MTSVDNTPKEFDILYNEGISKSGELIDLGGDGSPELSDNHLKVLFWLAWTTLDMWAIGCNEPIPRRQSDSHLDRPQTFARPHSRRRLGR